MRLIGSWNFSAHKIGQVLKTIYIEIQSIRVDFLLVAGFMNLIFYQVHSFIYLQKQLRVPVESLNIIFI